MTVPSHAHEWDVFVSHATEDKDDFVRPLVHGLSARGLRVWFDEFSLKVGDSLRRSIDRGLAKSRFGIVVISPHFLRKEWPQRELDGLVAREIGGEKVILPVWHNLTVETLRKYSPTLADKKAVSSSEGIDRVIDEIIGAMTLGERTLPSNAAYSERGTTFQSLSVGRFFRFYHRGESTTGLKAVFNYGTHDEVGVVLTPTTTGLQPGDLLASYEIEDVVALPGIKITPSTKSATPGAGNIAQPGEIELQGSQLIFVTKRGSSVHLVNLQSAEIGRDGGARPVEIYSEWSLLRIDAPNETIYERRIDWVSKGSEFHTADHKGGTIDITPTDQHSPEGLRQFTAIVNRAIADGYTPIITHKSSMIPGDFYDRVIFAVRE